MVRKDGVGYYSRCLMTYPRKVDAIPPECSYKWEGSNKQPRWSLGYKPTLGNMVTEIW